MSKRKPLAQFALGFSAAAATFAVATYAYASLRNNAQDEATDQVQDLQLDAPQQQNYNSNYMQLEELQQQKHYIPDFTLVQEIESLPLSQRLLSTHIIFPFRPLLVPMDGSTENEASDMFAFPGGVGLKKNSRVEEPDEYERQLIRGSTLYGKNRIEYAFQGYDAVANVLIKVVRFGANLCGHPGIVHGGLIAAFFDDAFGSLFWINSNGQFTGVTANLTVNYRAPMPAPQNVAFVLWVDKIEGRKVFLKAEARSVADSVEEEGEIGSESADIGSRYVGSKSIKYAEATALFIKLNRDQESEKLKKANK
ncbi:UNVERIFIED_CONTAM: hypothetical protein HDU68_008747 [Siphonaria sp. JEL0065]|nr:hypothetical protein HDU68_008747 [Siphonaria sp. JEL0065]